MIRDNRRELRMKRFIYSATNSLPKDIKIDGKCPEVAIELYQMRPEAFDGVSRISTFMYADGYGLELFYGRKKGGYYKLPSDADEDDKDELLDDIYGLEYSNRYIRHKELAAKSKLADQGQVQLSASALVSRLIKAEFGLSTYRDPSGRNARYVYYPLDRINKSPEEFYNNDFLPFIDQILKQYPDIYIDCELSRGYGPRLYVIGPDYAWDKNTKTATPIE